MLGRLLARLLDNRKLGDVRFYFLIYRFTRFVKLEWNEIDMAAKNRNLFKNTVAENGDEHINLALAHSVWHKAENGEDFACIDAVD